MMAVAAILLLLAIVGLLAAVGSLISVRRARKDEVEAYASDDF
ncbi:hypothetical protein [uncultured Desulfovibrio sp.]|nr:hypothetical protein [uncultured Desulfovibrio sp.]